VVVVTSVQVPKNPLFVCFGSKSNVGLLTDLAGLKMLRSVPEGNAGIFCLIGLALTGYLTYIENQTVFPVCVHAGDRNAAQNSQYAKILDVIPVGAGGMLGYLAILVSWAWRRFRQGWLADMVPMAIFGKTFFGVLFSIYLTYQEPFIIGAVCLCCLSSFVIITLLFLLNLPPLIGQLAEGEG